MKKFYFIFITFLVIFFISNFSQGAYVTEGIESFPDSYKPYLYELNKKYPNWKFMALHTGLDWQEVIKNEYANSANLVPISYSDNWKCKENNLYNIEIDDGWVNASRNAVEYTMDTRNFLNYKRIFQFELLSYDETNNIEGIEKILYGTQFYKNKVSYKDSSRKHD